MFEMKKAHVLLVFFVLVFIVFGRSVAGDFVFDDRNIMDHEQMLSSFNNVGQVIMAPFWDTQSSLYRPVTLLSYVVNFQLGAWPEFFHILNLLLYASTVFLIYLFVNRISKDERVGIITATLFLVLPIHTEVVANISNRTELFALLFSLLALLEASRERARYWLLGLWTLLALGSKESAIAVVPLVLLVLATKETTINVDTFKRQFLNISSVGIGALIYFVLRFFSLGPAHYFGVNTTVIENPLLFTDWHSRILTALKVFYMYIEKTFWPTNLCPDYSYNQIPVVHSLDIFTFAGLAIFIAMIIAGVYLWKRKPIVSIALAIIIFSFLPASNILFPAGTIAGERLFYMPSLGICILLALFVSHLYEKGRFVKIITTVLFGFIICVYAYISFVHQKVWLNERELFMSAVACAPESVLSRSNAGAMYYLAGDMENAKIELEYARDIMPVYSKGLNNLGLVYEKLGDKSGAERMYLEAIKQDFPYPGAYENLIQLYIKEKRYADARRWLNVLYPNRSSAVDDLIKGQI